MKTRKYLCVENEDHTPETEKEIDIANRGICPVCWADMVWEYYDGEGGKMKYQGRVIDRLDNKAVVTKTTYKETYEAAHHAAEALAKRRGLYNSDRYSIIVEEEEE